MKHFAGLQQLWLHMQMAELYDCVELLSKPLSEMRSLTHLDVLFPPVPPNEKKLSHFIWELPVLRKVAFRCTFAHRSGYDMPRIVAPNLEVIESDPIDAYEALESLCEQSRKLTTIACELLDEDCHHASVECQTLNALVIAGHWPQLKSAVWGNYDLIKEQKLVPRPTVKFAFVQWMNE